MATNIYREVYNKLSSVWCDGADGGSDDYSEYLGNESDAKELCSLIQKRLLKAIPEMTEEKYMDLYDIPERYRQAAENVLVARRSVAVYNKGILEVKNIIKSELSTKE